MRGNRSLAEALEESLTRWAQRTGISVETWALPAGEVPERVSRAVMIVLEEALDNVERHSGARVVSVAVTMSRSGLRLTVSDDGAGFDRAPSGPGRPPLEGRGIAAMRAALAEQGGTLSVTSTPGAGTTVRGVIPSR
ncbi:sensor histidine kinase [Thermostaphylospora chromogena]|uniref:histidine kinase n=1 Tax=Thermostaphylospora chromogena TaxID=35622 RepID=A0A1H1G128_9ACTN|nr:ATP-binding protein [Thermostaphylospora chromogena]SDR06815.1 Histidine kinase-like ATPase domain-containing protein [Thermostaphylospora chromogena]